MERGLATIGAQVSIDGNARHPRQPPPGKDKRPGVTVLARDVRVHKDVLQLASSAPRRRAHRQPRLPEAETEDQATLQVGCFGVVTSVA
ncbi:MAG: hypothetical protein AUI15_03985 [Actinobacteria bacterium 13_2_20CM_2_66_6]|nr:MAG: hypothetical protein AUI15_03985 [Actinobacteria bacterium 13_2_20CM_2_66_6]